MEKQAWDQLRKEKAPELEHKRRDEIAVAAATIPFRIADPALRLELMGLAFTVTSDSPNYASLEAWFAHFHESLERYATAIDDMA